ncbi:hypothetical protein ADEAN_000885700 [Angomonas deanei]|uniref:Uncharacterized protein n=1 Tax=Angomonas deanei TaxID=59799 RepID=A0A7G2CP97_9TRYP|nr:hypothetical protein ADEAN_000885700 [Angomonas deanei]
MNPDGIQNLPFVDCSVPLEGSLEDLRSKLAQEEQFIQQQRETEEAVLRRCFLLETVLQNMHRNGTTVDKMGGDTTFTTDEDASSMHVLLPWGDAVVQAKMNTRGLTEECRSLYATLSAQLRGGEGSSAPPAEGQTVDSVVILNSEEGGQEEDGDEEAEQHYFEHLAYVPPSMPLPSVTELPSGPSPPPGEVTNLVTPPATQTEKTDSPPCTPSPVRRELEEYFPKHEKRPRRESELERHMSRVISPTTTSVEGRPTRGIFSRHSLKYNQ